MVPHTPYIWAVGCHRSGDIWIAMETKAGHDRMVDSVEVWLPKLSGRLHYIQKTYPIIVHRVPTEFALLADEDGEDLMALIVEHNADIIVWPEALKRAEFLAPGHG